METFTLSKANGHKISCMKLIPENADRIIITVHGFGSHRECETAKMLYRRMTAEGIGVVSYDQPAHGDNESSREPLLIGECVNSLKTVEEYVRGTYPDAGILYFSSSFGAYITLLYLSYNKHSGHKAFLRSTAVNITTLIPALAEDYPDVLAEKGYYPLSMLGQKTIDIPAEFFDELAENDLTERFASRIYDDVDLEMIHGEKDDTIELPFAKAFADRFGIRINIVPDEGHTLSDSLETPEFVADTALAFYNR